MKILAFADMHGSIKALKELKVKSKKADVVVCAGDISIFEQKMEYFIKEFDRLKKTFLIIPGNHESAHDVYEVSLMFENAISLHDSTYLKEDVLFMGHGEGGFSVVDREFEKLSKKFESKIKKSNAKKTVLVTHAPPYKTKLDDLEGNSCGNKSIKNFIWKSQPTLAISGHLHENAGKEDKVKVTRIINPGPFGKIIEI